MNHESLQTERNNLDAEIGKLQVELARGKKVDTTLADLKSKRARLDDTLAGLASIASAEAAKREAEARAADEARLAQLEADHGAEALARDIEAYAAKVCPLVAQLADVARELVDRTSEGYRAEREARALAKRLGREQQPSGMPLWSPGILVAPIRDKIATHAIEAGHDWKILRVITDLMVRSG